MDCAVDISKALDLSYYDLNLVPDDEQFSSVVQPLVKHNFVPESVCKMFIKEHANKNRNITPGVATNGVAIKKLHYRNDESIVDPDFTSLEPYFNWDLIGAAVNEYWNTNFKYGVIPEFPVQYSIFFKGQYCKLHHDVIVVNNKLVRPTRRLTVLLYLNKWHYEEGKPDTFSGGQLLFPTIIDAYQQPFQIQPRAGTLVVFPANPKYVHLVSDVTFGERHTVVMFAEIVR